MKDILIMHKEMRVLSLTDDAIVYIGIPKEPMSNSLELLNKCGKATEYKINMKSLISTQILGMRK